MRALSALLLSACLPFGGRRAATLPLASVCTGNPSQAAPAPPAPATGAPAHVTLIKGALPDWRFWEVLANAPTPRTTTDVWGQEAPAPVDLVGSWFAQQAGSIRLSVSAEDASLSSLGAAISEATHLNVVVQGGLASSGISFSLHDQSLTELLTLLRQELGVYGSFEHGVLYLTDLDHRTSRAVLVELTPLVSRLVRVQEGVVATELAHAWCATSASPRGSAAVVGDQIFFQDTAPRVEAALTLVDMATPED